jgi:DNA polymerase III alpha subunit (gram-positive type)
MAAASLMREAMAMAETTGDQGTCPSCKSGDLISISMSVSGRELAFCTCHQCEAKWWFSDGEEVPLQSVIGLVVQKQ